MTLGAFKDWLQISPSTVQLWRRWSGRVATSTEIVVHTSSWARLWASPLPVALRVMHCPAHVIRERGIQRTGGCVYRSWPSWRYTRRMQDKSEAIRSLREAEALWD